MSQPGATGVYPSVIRGSLFLRGAEPHCSSRSQGHNCAHLLLPKFLLNSPHSTLPTQLGSLPSATTQTFIPEHLRPVIITLFLGQG